MSMEVIVELKCPSCNNLRIKKMVFRIMNVFVVIVILLVIIFIKDKGFHSDVTQNVKKYACSW